MKPCPRCQAMSAEYVEGGKKGYVCTKCGESFTPDEMVGYWAARIFSEVSNCANEQLAMGVLRQSIEGLLSL